MPLKIDFDGKSEAGHDGAYPVGSLTNVYLDGDIIRAKSVMWNNEFPSEDKYLKTATAEGKTLNTSWEMLYADSENVDGVEYLRGVQCLGTVIVKNPAYLGRTPILSIAEKTESDMMDEETVDSLKSQLMAIIGWVNDLYDCCMEMQQAEQQLSNPSDLTDKLTAIMDMIKMGNQKMTNMESSMASVTAEKEALSAKLQEKETELNRIVAEKAEAETKAKMENRKHTLAQFLSEDEVDEEILSLDDSAFDKYVKTLSRVANKAKASQKLEIPEPLGRTETSIKDIAETFRREVK